MKDSFENDNINQNEMQEALEAVTVKKESIEERYKRYREKLKRLTLMSDILSRNVLKDKRCTEYILRIIMKDRTLRVIDQRLQADYKNLHGRSVILDCVAIDGRDRKINIELQQDNEGASVKRARYHQALMDANILNPGENFDELPETYVIFITRRDALKADLPIVHVDRVIMETGKAFGDETHIIYVDSSKQDESELGRLMHDLNCTDASDMSRSVLADSMRVYKESRKGIEHMCSEMDEIRNEGILEGRKEGKIEAAKNMFKIGMKTEQVAKVLEVDEDTIRQWLGETVTV